MTYENQTCAWFRYLHMRDLLSYQIKELERGQTLAGCRYVGWGWSGFCILINGGWIQSCNSWQLSHLVVECDLIFWEIVIGVSCCWFNRFLKGYHFVE